MPQPPRCKAPALPCCQLHGDLKLQLLQLLTRHSLLYDKVGGVLLPATAVV
jgi:hypothetical protein